MWDIFGKIKLNYIFHRLFFDQFGNWNQGDKRYNLDKISAKTPNSAKF